jgi:catechol 2,3-dioxygenase-like lactoylglutathione lyase family enzyme
VGQGLREGRAEPDRREGLIPDLPPITGLLETGLYVEDVARSRAFYTRLFGFPVLVEDDRLCALDVAGRGVLLLFRKGGTTEPVHIPGGAIPGHGGDGTLHYAFAIAAAHLDAWARRLHGEGIEIESRVTWPRGGVSLYFRDPDGHLVELATPGVWATY